MTTIGDEVTSERLEDAETKILPCPFCGGNGDTFFKAVPNSKTGFWWNVVCNDHCLAEGGMAGTEAEAIAAWNRRSTAVGSTPSEGEARGALLAEVIRLIEDDMYGPGEAEDVPAREAFNKALRRQINRITSRLIVAPALTTGKE